jgi:hypothetical protein
MDDIDQLASLLLHVPFPQGIAPANISIRGPAFFPGGTGILHGSNGSARYLPRGGVMIIAHNFGTLDDYERAVSRGREDLTSRTWLDLLPFLTTCDIDPSRCFFTNALMGVLIGGSSIGSRPAHRDPAYRKACADILRVSIGLQRPGLILVCGIKAAAFVGENLPGLERWAGATTMTYLDEVGPTQWTDNIPVVAITHPSRRHLNVGRRRFGSLLGNAAELAMISAVRAIPATV